MYFDPLYILFSLPAFLIGLITTFAINATYKKYASILNSRNLTGLDVISKLSQKYGYNISFEEGLADLDNHYNPLNSTVLLSRNIARTPTISSVAIAAHEFGHVRQHKEGDFSIKLRTMLVPTLGLTTNLGYILIIIGLIVGISGLSWIGIFLFSGATIFSFLTLPVEFGASSKALAILKEEHYLDPVELEGAKKVLTAAAFTYVAATLQSLSTLLYFVFRVRGNSKRSF
jgi:uncharacterized protein